MNFIYEVKYRLNKTVTKLKCNYTGNFTEKFSDKNIAVNIGMDLINGCSNIKVDLVPNCRLEILTSKISIRQNYDDDYKLFLNGFQTWSSSSEIDFDLKKKRSSLLFKKLLAPFGDGDFYKSKKDVNHSWTYTYIRKSDKLSFFGSLNEDNGFTVFEHASSDDLMTIRKDIESKFIESSFTVFDLFVATAEECLVFDEYFKCMNVKPFDKMRYSGWSSSHIIDGLVSEDLINENLEYIFDEGIDLDIFQISQGYEKHIGDWLKINSHFPNGLKTLAMRIKDRNMLPSIWLAPFICDIESDIFKYHNEWIAKDKTGTPISVGYNPKWGGKFYVLDIYNQDVKLHLKDVFDTIIQLWGFEAINTDYLYAITHIKADNKTRGEIMCDGINLIKELSHGVPIVASGVPIGSVMGKVKFCSISSKISDSWENKFLRKLNFKERNTTENAIKSSIARRQLNGRAFISDPDVFTLRKSDNFRREMTTKQKEMLFYINHFFGGLIFTSDNISKYGKGQKEFISKSVQLMDFEVTEVEQGELLKVYGQLKGTNYLYVFNLKNTPATEEIEAINRELIMNKYDMKIFEI